MTANIWNDGKTVFWNIEVSLTDSPGLSGSHQGEGSFCIVEGGKFDVRGCYRLEFDNGKSADIVITYVIRRKQAGVYFRVLAWKDKPLALGSAPGKV